MLWTASQVLRKFSTSSVSNVANNHRGLMRELLWLREHRFSKCVCVALNACSGLRVMRRTEPGSGLTALILSKSLSCCIFSQHGKRWCTLCHVTVSTAPSSSVPPAARSDGAGLYCTISGGVASSSQEAHSVLAGARFTYDPAGLKEAASDGLFHFLSIYRVAWKLLCSSSQTCQMCTWQDLTYVHGKPETSMLNTWGGGSGMHLSLLGKGCNLHQPIAFLWAAFSQ